MCSGGFLGLQIRSRVVIPSEVGSTPTRFRQVILKGGGGCMTDKEIQRLTYMSSKAG